MEIDSLGHIETLTTCDSPDGLPFVEFYSGIIIENFDDDFRARFDAMLQSSDPNLDALLRKNYDPTGRSLVVISGLDYTTISLTPKSQISKILSLEI